MSAGTGSPNTVPKFTTKETVLVIENDDSDDDDDEKRITADAVILTILHHSKKRARSIRYRVKYTSTSGTKREGQEEVVEEEKILKRTANALSERKRAEAKEAKTGKKGGGSSKTSPAKGTPGKGSSKDKADEGVPTFATMVKDAIFALAEKKGSTLDSIAKWIEDSYGDVLNLSRLKLSTSAALRAAASKDEIVVNNGKYKLSVKVKNKLKKEKQQTAEENESSDEEVSPKKESKKESKSKAAKAESPPAPFKMPKFPVEDKELPAIDECILKEAKAQGKKGKGKFVVPNLPPRPELHNSMELPEEAIGDLLTVWEFLRSFGSTIGMKAEPALATLREAFLTSCSCTSRQSETCDATESSVEVANVDNNEGGASSGLQNGSTAAEHGTVQESSGESSGNVPEEKDGASQAHTAEAKSSAEGASEISKNDAQEASDVVPISADNMDVDTKQEANVEEDLKTEEQSSNVPTKKSQGVPAVVSEPRDNAIFAARHSVVSLNLALLKAALGRHTSGAIHESAKLSFEALWPVRELLGGLLNASTWPEVLCRFALSLVRYQEAVKEHFVRFDTKSEEEEEEEQEQVNEDPDNPITAAREQRLKDAIEALQKRGYWSLTPAQAIHLTRLIVDELVDAPALRQKVDENYEEQFDLAVAVRKAEAAERSVLSSTDLKNNATEVSNASENAKRAREAFYKQTKRVCVRRDPLGMDRDLSRYWSLPGDISAIHVEANGGENWAQITSQMELAEFVESLDTRGIRELALHQNLDKSLERIMQGLTKPARTEPERKEQSAADKLAQAVAVAMAYEEPRRSTRIKTIQITTALTVDETQPQGEDTTAANKPKVVKPMPDFDQLSEPWEHTKIAVNEYEILSNLKTELHALEDELRKYGMTVSGGGNTTRMTWRTNVQRVGSAKEFVPYLLELENATWSLLHNRGGSTVDWTPIRGEALDDEGKPIDPYKYISPYASYSKSKKNGSKSKMTAATGVTEPPAAEKSEKVLGEGSAKVLGESSSEKVLGEGSEKVLGEGSEKVLGESSEKVLVEQEKSEDMVRGGDSMEVEPKVEPEAEIGKIEDTSVVDVPEKAKEDDFMELVDTVVEETDTGAADNTKADGAKSEDMEVGEPREPALDDEKSAELASNVDKTDEEGESGDKDGGEDGEDTNAEETNAEDQEGEGDGEDDPEPEPEAEENDEESANEVLWEHERDAITFGQLKGQVAGCLSKNVEERSAWINEVNSILESGDENTTVISTLSLFVYSFSAKVQEHLPKLHAAQENLRAAGTVSKSHKLLLNCHATSEVVWARLMGFTWWPAIVVRPNSTEFEQELEAAGDLLVTFMGEDGQYRVSHKSCKPFVGGPTDDLLIPKLQLNKPLWSAVKMAIKALVHAYKEYGPKDPNAPQNRPKRKGGHGSSHQDLLHDTTATSAVVPPTRALRDRPGAQSFTPRERSSMIQKTAPAPTLLSIQPPGPKRPPPKERGPVPLPGSGARTPRGAVGSHTPGDSSVVTSKSESKVQQNGGASSTSTKTPKSAKSSSKTPKTSKSASSATTGGKRKERPQQRQPSVERERKSTRRESAPALRSTRSHDGDAAADQVEDTQQHADAAHAQNVPAQLGERVSIRKRTLTSVAKEAVESGYAMTHMGTAALEHVPTVAVPTTNPSHVPHVSKSPTKNSGVFLNPQQFPSASNMHDPNFASSILMGMSMSGRGSPSVRGGTVASNSGVPSSRVGLAQAQHQQHIRQQMAMQTAQQQIYNSGRVTHTPIPPPSQQGHLPSSPPSVPVSLTPSSSAAPPHAQRPHPSQNLSAALFQPQGGGVGMQGGGLEPDTSSSSNFMSAGSRYAVPGGNSYVSSPQESNPAYMSAQLGTNPSIMSQQVQQQHAGNVTSSSGWPYTNPSPNPGMALPTPTSITPGYAQTSGAGGSNMYSNLSQIGSAIPRANPQHTYVSQSTIGSNSGTSIGSSNIGMSMNSTSMGMQQQQPMSNFNAYAPMQSQAAPTYISYADPSTSHYAPVQQSNTMYTNNSSNLVGRVAGYSAYPMQQNTASTSELLNTSGTNALGILAGASNPPPMPSYSPQQLQQDHQEYSQGMGQSGQFGGNHQSS